MTEEIELNSAIIKNEEAKKDTNYSEKYSDQINEVKRLLSSSIQAPNSKFVVKLTSCFWVLLMLISWNVTMMLSHWEHLSIPFCVPDIGNKNKNVHILFSFSIYCLLLPMMYWRSIQMLEMNYPIVMYSVQKFPSMLYKISGKRTLVIMLLKYTILAGVLVEFVWLLSCSKFQVVSDWTPFIRLMSVLCFPIFSSLVLCPILSSLTLAYSYFISDLKQKLNQNWEAKSLQRLINYRQEQLQEAFLLLNNGLTQHVFSVNFIVFIFIIVASMNHLEDGTGLFVLFVPTAALGTMVYICTRCTQLSLQWDKLNQVLFQKRVEILEELFMHENEYGSNDGKEVKDDEEKDLESKALILKSLLDEITMHQPHFKLYGDIKINLGFFMTICGILLTFNNIIRSLAPVAHIT